MNKFQFLCSNYLLWLAANPEAAIHTWGRSYYRCIDLTEEQDYKQAITYAGAAYETAEILLKQEPVATAETIHRLADSAILLTKLFYELHESRLAKSVLNATVLHFDRLLLLGAERNAVLHGCARLIEIGEKAVTFNQHFTDAEHGKTADLRIY